MRDWLFHFWNLINYDQNTKTHTKTYDLEGDEQKWHVKLQQSTSIQHRHVEFCLLTWFKWIEIVFVSKIFDTKALLYKSCFAKEKNQMNTFPIIIVN